jgi:hypothetical protein
MSARDGVEESAKGVGGAWDRWGLVAHNCSLTARRGHL